MGSMREGELLSVARKEHGVLADEVAAAHHGKADVAGTARRAAPAIPDGDVGQLPAAPLSDSRAQGERGTRGRILLHPMMRLDDLDVEAARQRRGGGARKLEQHRGAETG